MKHRKELILSAACFLMAFLCAMSWLQVRAENLAGRIAPKILRLHVLANSNSKADQQLKLDVKSYLIKELARELPADAVDNKPVICSYIEEHKEDLEQKMEAFMASSGHPCHVDIRIAQTCFPTKTYGDLTLPCGVYDAVQVTLGQGRGRNWWCVLYPRLCFLDITHAVIPEESKQELRILLGDDDYESLFHNRQIKLTVKFKLLEWWKNRHSHSSSTIPSSAQS